jgi:hypothetical protein
MPETSLQMKSLALFTRHSMQGTAFFAGPRDCSQGEGAPGNGEETTMSDSILPTERTRLYVAVWRRRKFRLHPVADCAGSVFMSNSIIFLALAIVMYQPSRLPAQTVVPAKAVVQAADVVLPKPAVEPAAGTWKYAETDVASFGTYHSTFSVTIKDDGAVWTVTTDIKFVEGPVTDVLALEKGTLVPRKEWFKHFLHKGQPWKPVEIDLDFAGNKVTGTKKYVSGADKPVAFDLGGPLFAGTGTDVTVGCLPLADGYSTTFRYFDVEQVALDRPDREKLMQLKVVGVERVTVPAGTFDSYKVELTSPDGSDKHTVWIAKQSRTPVKSDDVAVYKKGTVIATTELVP